MRFRRYALFAALAVASLNCLAHGDDAEQWLRKLRPRLVTKSYVLAGTASAAEFKEYGRALEAMHTEYERGFAEVFAAASDAEGEGAADAAGARSKPEARPAGGSKPSGKQDDEPASVLEDATRYRVVLLQNRREYAEFAKLVGVQGEHAIGMYVPRYRLLVVLVASNRNETYSTLFHEASHQVLARYVPNPPTWLNEGLADYFGSARPAGKGVRFSAPERDTWKLMREAVAKKKVIPFEQVLLASRPQFYDMTPLRVGDWDTRMRTLYYGQAYTLIHMMLNDPDGRRRLLNYMRALAADPKADRNQITQKHFETEFIARKLEPGWAAYVKSHPE